MYIVWCFISRTSPKPVRFVHIWYGFTQVYYSLNQLVLYIMSSWCKSATITVILQQPKDIMKSSLNIYIFVFISAATGSFCIGELLDGKCSIFCSIITNLIVARCLLPNLKLYLSNNYSKAILLLYKQTKYNLMCFYYS